MFCVSRKSLVIPKGDLKIKKGYVSNKIQRRKCLLLFIVWEMYVVIVL